MRVTPTDAGLDRRQFLAGTTAAAIIVSSGSLIHPTEAWGLEVKNLKPQTMLTLVKVARDTYPHDRLPDRFYAIAVKDYDAQAGANPATKTMIEDGVAKLDALAMQKHGMPYAALPWEEQRVALLREIQGAPFFQTVRGNLIIGLYNQKEVWPLFGYEGESASKGGYVDRGFNDIAWL
jgi:hypothetical protein